MPMSALVATAVLKELCSVMTVHLQHVWLEGPEWNAILRRLCSWGDDCQRTRSLLHFLFHIYWRIAVAKLDPPDEREGRVSNLELAIITLPD